MMPDNKVKETLEKLEKGVKNIFDSGKFAEYLKTMSRFHNYSYHNTLLIHMARPDATMVAGYKGWKTKFGRNVKKGEKAIRILAPTPFTLREEKEKLDPVTRKPILDENGQPLVEQIERKIARFKLVSVFDASQTVGRPLPSLAQDLAGNVSQYEAFVDALKAISPLPIEMEQMPDTTDGYCRAGDKIGIREGMSEIQTVCAIIHEIVHAKLHDKKSLTADGIEIIDRQTEEVTAESISFTVSNHFGIETGDNSFGYIAAWSKGKELKELRASLDLIHKTSTELISAIDDKFQEILKERGISLEKEISTEDYKPTKDMPIEEVLNNRDEMVNRIMTYILTEDPDYPQKGLADIEGNMREKPLEDLRDIDYFFYFPNDKPDIAKEAADIRFYPDETVMNTDMTEYGYVYDEMLPLAQARALELFSQNHAIYLLHNDGKETLIFDEAEIRNNDGIFGIERDEWASSMEYAQKSGFMKNTEHGKEAELLYEPGNRFGIYQINNDIDNARDLRFTPLAQLKEQGLEVDRSNYSLAYTAPFAERVEFLSDRYPVLNRIFRQFNEDHPQNYKGHSASVSDVIVLKYNDGISAHYIDSKGFVEIDSFTGNEQKTLASPDIQSRESEKTSETAEQVKTVKTVAEFHADLESGQPISLMEFGKALKSEEAAKNKQPPATKPSLKERIEVARRRTEMQDQPEPRKSKGLEVSQ